MNRNWIDELDLFFLEISFDFSKNFMDFLRDVGSVINRGQND